MVHPMIVIGSDGFIGRHFCNALPQAHGVCRGELDLLQPKITFPTAHFSYALIAAGLGNPKKCEMDPHTSYRCNVKGTLQLGKMLLEEGVTPIFLSSDYVFNDALEIAPLNSYGRQKAELEHEALAMDALVVRLSKVYGVAKGDGSLFDEMASKLKAGSAVLAARDQIFAPIYIGDVIAQVVNLMQGNARGVVNVVGPNFASRAEMAKRVAQSLGANLSLVKEIALKELNDGIQRPKFLKLTSSFPSLSWEEGVEQVVRHYAN